MSRVSRGTTTIGYTNRNHQTVVNDTGRPGTHNQRAYEIDATFADASTNAMALIFSSAVAQNMMAADQGSRSRYNQNWTLPISDDQDGGIT
jgi:hypothetical protein